MVSRHCISYLDALNRLLKYSLTDDEIMPDERRKQDKPLIVGRTTPWNLAQTTVFSVREQYFSSLLRLAQRGHTSLKIQLLDHGRAASEHMGRLLTEIQDTGTAHKEIRSIYTKFELAIYRNGGPLPQSFFSKSLPEIFKIAKINFEKHPEVKRLPREKELINTFIFRSCLCYYLLALDWVARGGGENAKPEKHRNDLIDSIFVTFATYFDGFMTCDARASRVYDEASTWISVIQRANRLLKYKPPP